jgi:allophanate hydrolase
MAQDSLDLTTLSADYAAGRRRIADVLKRVRERIAAYADPAVWISRLSDEAIDAQIGRAEIGRAGGAALPLYGIPFAVKDNIDVEGEVTTAACPAFAYRAPESATIVRKLCEAGAILVGKTNMDQFATGLVGTRSPYGAVKNTFDPAFICGGSSAGSAAAVSAGLVSFALGTDTAGSGRVPAGFNNIVGWKPTRGIISTAGIVPACQSLDCVSVFALTCDDAAAVASVARGFDARDAYSRKIIQENLPETLRVGTPKAEQLEFFGNREYARIYAEAISRVTGKVIEIDLAPSLEAANLLYDGPWVAERVAGLRKFVDAHPEALLPVIAKIFAGAARFSAADAFEAAHRLEALKQRAQAEWAKMDALLLPTTGTIYRRDEIDADPIQLNKNLGRYTNFVNLMDLCAVALPAGMTTDGLPCGVTLIAPPGCDDALLQAADAIHRTANLTLGKTGCPMPAPKIAPPPTGVLVAVVGAHLTGFPLNAQLTDRKAELVKTCRTHRCYRLFALPGTNPPKPGLLRVPDEAGAPIEVEIWRLSHEAFGNFVAAIPPPLSIGTLRLEDETRVKGFLCEAHAIEDATDITHFGGWRNYCRSIA